LFQTGGNPGISHDSAVISILISYLEIIADDIQNGFKDRAVRWRTERNVQGILSNDIGIGTKDGGIIQQRAAGTTA
jgi:hypothetical protein